MATPERHVSSWRELIVSMGGVCIVISTIHRATLYLLHTAPQKHTYASIQISHLNKHDNSFLSRTTIALLYCLFKCGIICTSCCRVYLTLIQRVCISGYWQVIRKGDILGL